MCKVINNNNVFNRILKVKNYLVKKVDSRLKRTIRQFEYEIVCKNWLLLPCFNSIILIRAGYIYLTNLELDILHFSAIIFFGLNFSLENPKCMKVTKFGRPTKCYNYLYINQNVEMLYKNNLRNLAHNWCQFSRTVQYLSKKVKSKSVIRKITAICAKFLK